MLRTTPPWVLTYIRLFERSRRYHMPPFAGGVVDQPVRAFAILDVIEDEMRIYFEWKRVQNDAMREARARMGIPS